jgi:hypothetical protein
MFRSNFAWNDYFDGAPSSTYQQTRYTSCQSPTSSNLYVFRCLFIGCSSSNAGGALSITNTAVSNMLIESTSFFTCTSSSRYGGAIHIDNSNSGQSVLYSVCAYNCYCTNSDSYGQFTWIGVKNDALSKNYINYSSIVRCVGAGSSPTNTLCQTRGKMCFPSVNISMNRCYQRSGILCHPYKNASAITCYISFTTVADNYASDYNCIWSEYPNTKTEIKYCNIIRNSQGSLSSIGTIYIGGSLDIANSCILANSANYIFYGASTATFTISSCTVDQTTNNGYLTIQNTVTKSFLLALNHFSTQNCYARYDSAGGLTASQVIECPTKEVIYIKVKMSIIRIRDFSLLNYVFLVAFIHPNPFGYC